MSVENLLKKWAPVLDHSELPGIQGNHKRSVTAQLLENQEIACRQDAQGSGGYRNQTSLLSEAAPANNSALFEIIKRPVNIGSRVWVCARVFIHPGVSIADGVVIGACSVVSKDLMEEWIVYGGNPVKKISKRILK